MRLNNFISITPDDMSPLHQEIISIYDAFIASASDANEAKAFEALFKTEYPNILRLKDIIESVLIGQQNTRVYDRIKDPKRKESKIVKLKIIKREDKPDEPA